MGILVVVAAGCYTFGNHRTKAVSPRGLAEAYFFSPLKKKRPPGLLSSHVPEQIKTLTSFWGHHGWLGMQPIMCDSVRLIYLLTYCSEVSLCDCNLQVCVVRETQTGAPALKQ